MRLAFSLRDKATGGLKVPEGGGDNEQAAPHVWGRRSIRISSTAITEGSRESLLNGTKGQASLQDL